MLNVDDGATIRNAITKRLSKELNVVRVLEINIKEHADCLRVGVLTDMDAIILRSLFDLPKAFYHNTLLNQIDEIAEQCKAAWLNFHAGVARGMSIGSHDIRTTLGTGLRGAWKRADA
jgi:hypothetical protein